MASGRGRSSGASRRMKRRGWRTSRPRAARPWRWNRAPSLSAYRRRRTWRRTGSICWPGRIRGTGTVRCRPSGSSPEWWRGVLDPAAEPLVALAAADGGHGRGVAPDGRRSRAQGGVPGRGRAGAGSGRRPVSRRRRDRDPAPVRAQDAALGASHAGILGCRGPACPSKRGGLGGEDRELVQVLDGLRKNKTPRRIAEDIWGKARVAAEWNSDSWMRSQVRRWIPKARALADGGWRDLVPRYVPEE